MLSISDVLLAGRGVITGPGVISAAVLVFQDVCLVGCTLRSGGSLPTEAAMGSGGHGKNVVWKTFVLLKSFLFKRASGCVCSKGPCAVCGDRPRDVIPGHAGVIVLET